MLQTGNRDKEMSWVHIEVQSSMIRRSAEVFIKLRTPSIEKQLWRLSVRIWSWLNLISELKAVGLFMTSGGCTHGTGIPGCWVYASWCINTFSSILMHMLDQTGQGCTRWHPKPRGHTKLPKATSAPGCSPMSCKTTLREGNSVPLEKRQQTLHLSVTLNFLKFRADTMENIRLEKNHLLSSLEVQTCDASYSGSWGRQSRSSRPGCPS